jgi:hypothetical protein
LPSLNAEAEGTAAVVAFTAAVVVASTAAVADLMQAASAVVDAPHSVAAGGRMAVRIVGVELIAEGDSHRGAPADRHIAAAGSRHAALDLAADRIPARTAGDSAVRAASAAQAGSEPAMRSPTVDGTLSAAAAQ